MSNARTVLIMGPPGAGKGTQAAHLVDQYGLRHLATGDVLRKAIADGTETGVLAKTFMDKGELVPDDVTIGVFREMIEAMNDDEGLLIDGFPRTVAQAEALATMLEELGRSVDAALDISVPSEVLVERLSGRWICRDCQTPYNENSNPPTLQGKCDKCGGELYQRDDDTSEAVVNRLEVYARQTAPVSGWYEERNLLEKIDGNQSAADVQADLDAVLTAGAPS